jgi:hypothetical protein
MKTNWFFGLLLGLLAACPVLAADPAGSLPEIAVRVVNSAKVPPAALSQAERQAAYIFWKAGVALAWQDCSGISAAGQSGPCDSALGPTDFWLHVAGWKPQQASPEALGFTLLPLDAGTDQNLSGVYYPLVRVMAASYQMEESGVLAAAMAHEIGHLLGVGHTPTGVMCPQFGRRHIIEANSGGLLFSAPQTAQILSEIARRKAARRVP